MEFEKINIRGVNVANVTMDEAVEIAKNYINNSKKKSRAIYTPNAEIMQTCIDDKTGELFNIINSADMIIPDGAGVVLASKILKTPLKQKVGGYDFTYNHIIPYLDKTGGTLFLLGATEENVKKAVSVLNGQYKNLKVFYNNGWFEKSGEENDVVIEKINECSPDVILVGLSAPGQEKWIYSNKDRINVKIIIGGGGTIDVIAGAKKYAPKIFRKLNLEWFYYLITHPSRIGRYMKLPKFAIGTFFAKKNKKIKK